MKTILKITSSARGPLSNSNKLVEKIVEELQHQHPDASIIERNLVSKTYPHLEEAHLAAFFAPAEDNSEATLVAASHSDQAIAEINQADVIVIGVPIYNFNIPSALKAWIDHIVRAQKTFSYGSGAPEGLIKGKKVYLAVASGGIYSEGPLAAISYAEPYLKTILGFIGIDDVTIFRVEGVNVPGIKESALEKGLASVVV
ncbi:NAD(P)H-dependent oxidoreductase [Terrimonas sp. NA20]|uniref:FMN dependent NADH:quinone oxidoreductase n=1 Tax=Terrimonas ginsenosidimutans TaxID=2908004 RepID=A0ABS9KKP5_9BACT|nr:NAD(P)H-dependent oxidoreductase [Terrimonas ginsenosidimutans]MCG2612891.1 NAD(P)H-dependent oxidoreductase [Terrimonas ginsenosidimutans]